jgi:ABC-type transport system involved in multi-copper enzyme maturation permease subunit
MNAFVEKEARLQLPTLAIGLGATLMLWFVPNDPAHPHASVWWFQFYVCVSLFTAPLIGLMLALNSFGREFSSGTFSWLLAQPISKQRVWWTKIAVLASALLLLLSVWLASVSIHFREVLSQPEARNTPVATVALLFTAVIFSGGLWTVLLFRQVAAAFWFTLLIPALLLVIVHHKFYDEAVAGSPQAPVRLAAILTLCLYSLAGFAFARWLFLRAQDVQWSGGAIALPWRRTRAEQTLKGIDRRRWRPRAALWCKEFRLHQSQFILGGVLAVLHVVALIAREHYHDFKESPVTQFIAGQFWVLWLFMPWLVGCAAVAEERKVGTMEAQLCLPARRRTQFIAKLLSAVLIAVVLGAVMPLLFEGENILPDWKIESPGNFALLNENGDFILLGNFLRLVNLTLPFLILAAIALSTFSVSFYVSTFSRNTLQAIAPAALGILAFYMWWFAAPHLTDNPLWHGWLIHYVGVPVLLPTLIGLAYWNFRQVHASWSVWRRNSLVLGSAFGFVLLATGLTYHRAWEWFTPREPKHGIAFLRPVNSPAFHSETFWTLLRLPDGHFWRGFGFQQIFQPAPPDVAKQFTEQWQRGEVFEGTNWLVLTGNFRELLGIKTDGSLWVSETRFNLPNWWQYPPPAATRFSPLGQDTDWCGAAANVGQGFLLKTNGTLWLLGTNRPSGKSPLFIESIPKQLGTETDWAHVALRRGSLLAHKRDGSTWMTYQTSPQHKEEIVLEPQMKLFRAPAFDRDRGLNPITANWNNGACYVSVLEDGTFAVTSAWEPRPQPGRPLETTLVPKRVLLSRETNWLSAAIGGPGVVLTLKSDGTLWQWKFHSNPVKNPKAVSVKRLGQNSDWVGLSEYYGLSVALAGDGSVWTWLFPARSNSEPRPFPPNLAPTRRPILVGQISPLDVAGK